MVNLGFWVDFVLKTAKMKLPLHDLLIVKATAPAAATVLLHIFPFFPFPHFVLSVSNVQNINNFLFLSQTRRGDFTYSILSYICIPLCSYILTQ